VVCLLRTFSANQVGGNMYGYEDDPQGYGGGNTYMIPQFTTNGMPPGTASMGGRLGTANPWNNQAFYNGQEGMMNRPMTSVNAVGFSSKPKSNLPETFGSK
jgi:hypothetical protein